MIIENLSLHNHSHESHLWLSNVFIISHNYWQHACEPLSHQEVSRHCGISSPQLMTASQRHYHTKVAKSHQQRQSIFTLWTSILPKCCAHSTLLSIAIDSSHGLGEPYTSTTFIHTYTHTYVEMCACWLLLRQRESKILSENLLNLSL